MRIILAKDTKDREDALIRGLSAEGHVLLRVEDGQRLVKNLTDNPPETFEVVLIDLDMAEITAIQTIRQIRSHRLFQTIPIILFIEDGWIRRVPLYPSSFYLPRGVAGFLQVSGLLKTLAQIRKPSPFPARATWRGQINL